MLQYRQCKIKYRNGMSGTDAEALLRKKIARQLHVPEDRLRNVTIVRQSLDARKKRICIMILPLFLSVERKRIFYRKTGKIKTFLHMRRRRI